MELIPDDAPALPTSRVAESAATIENVSYASIELCKLITIKNDRTLFFIWLSIVGFLIFTADVVSEFHFGTVEGNMLC